MLNLEGRPAADGKGQPSGRQVVVQYSLCSIHPANRARPGPSPRTARPPGSRGSGLSLC